MAGQAPNMDQFEAYFQRADVDRDGRVSGNEAVAFLQASNLPRQVLAQVINDTSHASQLCSRQLKAWTCEDVMIWMYADQNRVGFLGRSEFYNCLKLVTVAQSKRELTPDLVKAALYGPASARIPAPQINLAATAGSQSNAKAGPSPVQVAGPPTSTQGIGASAPHGFLTQQSPVTRPPRPLPPSSGFQSQPGISAQGMPVTGSMPVSHPPNSFDSLGGVTDGSRARLSSQVSNRSLNPSPTQGDIGLVPPPITQPKAPDVTGLLQSASSKPNDTALSSSQVRKEDSKSPSATGNGFASDFGFGDVFSVTPSQPQNNSTTLTSPAGSVTASSTGNLTYSRDQPTVKQSAVSQPSAIQAQQFQSAGKANQHVLAHKPSAFPVAAGQSQPPWPKMTQSDVQKYRNVFVQVDSDRDGKITGEQARNLFLSWRLPREVLMQVWDLSDQDNDRKGPLPTTLPNSVMFDETLLPASGQPAAAYGNTSWRPSPGFQQPQGTKSVRPVISSGVGKPPRPVPVPQPDEPIQQKAKVPVLEKHLLDQLSTEEQDSLNKKFEDAKDAEKKVADLEKDISEAKQKFNSSIPRCKNLYHLLFLLLGGIVITILATELQALHALWMLNHSSLVIPFIGEKMELYRAIVKLEQENADGVQDRANQIQSDLEELVKALNERCKTYGLRGKPTSLVELPFGWQPGIEATAADWDEVWDKFEDEGFTYVKELTLEVENVIAPPKPKSALIREQVTSLDNSGTVKSPSKADDTSDLPNSGGRVHENDRLNTHNPEQTVKSPPDSPAGSNTAVSPEFGNESVLSGDRRFDEPGWGSFDTHYDSDAAWDFNSVDPKEAERERQSEGSLFGPDDWGLNPIKTGFSEGSEEQHSFDSFSRFDSFNMHDSGPFGSRDSFSRFDSMRSTRDSEFDSFGQRESLARFDSFRSTADSDYNFGSSFPPRDSLTRFDSMRSTRDSEYGHGFPSFDDAADPFGSGEPFRTSSHDAQTPRKDSDNWKAF
ncbi:hypothetical protein DH2020_038681 [Rehmannia glutinosa]|uniref:Uncharacterized protein n=1 Tax=Rehmannia glutinosa TaxID=99300 RepID=A0ABR0UZ14_REHGL